MDVEDTLDICGAMVIPRNQSSAQFMGWGQETVSTVLSPQLSSPEVRLLVDRLKSVDLRLTEQIEVIDTRTQTFFVINKQEAEKQMVFPLEKSFLHCKISSPGPAV